MPAHIPRILVVGTGAVGGIGRFERLLMAALSDMSEREVLSFTAIWRRRHPAYLQTSGDADLVGLASEASMPAFGAQFARALLHARPDLVFFLHVNLARAGPVARALGTRRYAVVTHGVEVWSPLDSIRRRALHAASGVLSVSQYTADQLLEHQGLPGSRIAVVPLALEPDWIRDAAAASRPHRDRSPALNREPRLLSVSRLERSARDKGIDHVIDSLPEVRSAIPGVRYHVVGDGSDRAYLEQRAKQCGVSDVVDFRGPVSHDDLVEEYRAADVFVLPSQREGFGLVFLEAMAYAKPVVARRAAAAVEVVVDGTTGILIDDERALGSTIVSVLSDTDRMHAMGQAGLERLRDVYSFAAFTARLEAAIRAALSG